MAGNEAIAGNSEFHCYNLRVFERFTEAARRTIFLAKEEAERSGSQQIETEHLLLGTFGEEALINHLLGSALPKEIRSQIEQNAPNKKKNSTDIDVSLSDESKAILNLGAAEADRIQDKQVGNEHLILGIMIQGKCFAATLLFKNGASLEMLRERVARLRSDPALATSITQSSPSRADWSVFGIPSGYAYPKLLYNPASEMLIIQVEGVDQLRPKRLYTFKKGELILPQGFSEGWISDLIAVSDDRAYIKAALCRAGKSGPRSKVNYFLAVLDLASRRVETLSELRAVLF